MKIDVLTLFPDMFCGLINTSIIKRAIDKKKVTINIIDFREYSPLNNKQVDDTPYGGGAGMVLRCEPLFVAVDKLRKKNTKIILLTPDGVVYKQSMARKLSNLKHIILICGHYEGFDERIRTLCDYELSIGDYILTGGEIPAMAVIDSIVRLIPGVINDNSLESESFNNNLLDYPTYTKPSEYRGLSVPEVLLNGNHKEIEIWRKNEQLKKIRERRSDLNE